MSPRTRKRQRYLGDSNHRDHVAIAERAVGHRLPRGAQVHHVNGNGRDNRPGNLVVCQDAAYHALLHKRQRALKECGCADWVRCRHCRQWGPPSTMWTCSTRPAITHHSKCDAAYQRAARIRRGPRPRRPAWKTEQTCEQCQGAYLTANPKRQRFCSLSCAMVGRTLRKQLRRVA